MQNLNFTWDPGPPNKGEGGMLLAIFSVGSLALLGRLAGHMVLRRSSSKQ